MDENNSQNNIPAVPEATTPEPTTTPAFTAIPENNDSLVKPLRTYGDDVKNVVQTNNVSTSKIFMAEQKKREAESQQETVNDIKQKPNIIKTVISIFFVLLGLGAIAYSIIFLLPKININTPIPVVMEKNAFFDVNQIVEIDISQLTKRESLARIREVIAQNADLNEGEALKIKIVKEVKVEENAEVTYKSVEINTLDFINLIEARTPEQLTRNLENEFLLGIHKTFGVNEPFLIFTYKDREITYSNMFTWEEYLVGDIRDIFFSKLGSSTVFNESLNQLPQDDPTLESATDSDTSTTTEEILKIASILETDTEPQEPTYDPLKFTDLILSNKDTRAIVNTDDEILFFYSLTNIKNLVFANNLETFKLINNKINNADVIK